MLVPWTTSRNGELRSSFYLKCQNNLEKYIVDIKSNQRYIPISIVLSLSRIGLWKEKKVQLKHEM